MSPTLSSRTWRRFALVSLSTAAVLALVESIARHEVRASPLGAGTLAGLELPPMRLFGTFEGPTHLDPGAVVETSPDGRRLTRADLWGWFRLDPVLGYTYQESVVSTNGWWRSNNVGARASEDAGPEPPAGRTRLLIFGDSFTNGSRLPQESAWPTLLAREFPELEVLNFGVDGYSMAQALLRHRDLRSRLRYDFVLLLFVPESDLWRDLNTLRQLDDPRWQMPLVPRFELHNEELRLVEPLYDSPAALWKLNLRALSPELRRHLRAHDRLYFSSKFEEPMDLGFPTLARLVSRARWIRQERTLRDGLMDPGGEALRVSRAIFLSMHHTAAEDQAEFVLALLPFEHRWWNKAPDASALQTWRTMAAFVCAEPIRCVDLLPGMLAAPRSEIDRASDDWHFGPATNRRVAELVGRSLDIGTDRAVGSSK